MIKLKLPQLLTLLILILLGSLVSCKTDKLMTQRTVNYRKPVNKPTWLKDSGQRKPAKKHKGTAHLYNSKRIR